MVFKILKSLRILTRTKLEKAGHRLGSVANTWANAARTSLHCQSSCHWQCSCPCCCRGAGTVRPLTRDILCRDWVQRIPFLRHHYLPPRRRGTRRGQQSESPVPLNWRALRPPELARASPRNINNVHIGWNVCWYLLKYLLIFVEIYVFFYFQLISK
jgi:hypothetical protein